MPTGTSAEFWGPGNEHVCARVVWYSVLPTGCSDSDASVLARTETGSFTSVELVTQGNQSSTLMYFSLLALKIAN